MAKKATAKASTALKGVKGRASVVLGDLAAEGGKVQVVGRFKNGKLELDHSSLQELGTKFPNANLSFIAVNAPFDPVRS